LRSLEKMNMKSNRLLIIIGFLTIIFLPLAISTMEANNNWIDITQLKKEQFELSNQITGDKQFDYQTHISKVFYYNADQTINPSDIKKFLKIPHLVLFIIHGTFVPESPEFSDPNNPVMKAIMNYAKNLGSSVEIVSFRWSAGNTDDDRIDAGTQLAQLINANYINKKFYTELHTLAHSHGGNVVNTATNKVKRTLDTIINIFTPARHDRQEYLPKFDKFNILYNFYSTGDQVQYFGSYDLTEESWSKLYNAVTEWRFSDLWNIGAGLKGGRKVYHNQGLRKVINFRVLYNGESPSHVEKGLLIDYLLSSIIKEVNTAYKLNCDFDLNIDSKTGKIYLAIRHPVNIKNIPLKEEILEQVKIKNQLKKELEYSAKIEKEFTQQYGKDIHGKGSRLGNIMREMRKLTE
jgi:hypothetical protein